jgi:hypothetical protein
MTDRAKSLQDLDGQVWPEPAYNSYLITTCHRLRRKPLDQLTAEDLRILIGQNIGLDVLVPLAIELLEQNPLVSGDFYPGDLLAAVVRADPAFWRRDSRRFRAVQDIVRGASARAHELGPADRETLAEVLRGAAAFTPSE